MKLDFQFMGKEEGCEGCFRIVDNDADYRIIGYLSVYDAQTLADSINIQIAATEKKPINPDDYPFGEEIAREEAEQERYREHERDMED